MRTFPGGTHLWTVGMALAYYVVSPSHLQPIIVFKRTLQEAGAVELFFEGNWLQWEWPNEWHNASIMAKELRSTDSLEMCCMGSQTL